MNKYLLTVLIVFMTTFSLMGKGKISEQLKAKLSTVKGSEKVLVWVFFSDKGLNKASNQDALKFVSQKSLDRRSKLMKQNALIDNTDLPVLTSYVNSLKTTGFLLRQKSKWFNAISGYIASDKVELVSALPGVKEIDLVGRYRYIQQPVTKAEEVKTMSKVKGENSLSYGGSLTQLKQINVPAVHDMGLTGKGITIGVFDAGVNNLKHEAFQRVHIIAQWDFVNHGPSVSDSVGRMGEGSHGTETLSAIGGFKEGQLVGPAYEANYILAKTENTDSETPLEEDNWVAAIEWADSIGVDVTSTSLGYLVFDAPYTSYTWQDMNGRTAIITKAAAMAARKGIVVVNSAGNEGEDPTHNTLSAPADADSIITVGAVDSTGLKVRFSSIGPTSDGRIKPDVMAMGAAVYLASPLSTSGYTRQSGTSFSCPLTAGVAALVLSANPAMTPVQVREALRTTASRANSPDNFYGYGIINALEAVKYARGLVTDVENQGSGNIPDNYTLYPNYPNPFNPSTNIRFAVPKESELRLELYNILGVKVAELFNGRLEKGIHTYRLDGSGLASGIYLVRMSAPNYNSVIKIILEK